MGPFSLGVGNVSYVIALRCDKTKWVAATTISTRKDVADGLKRILDELHHAVGHYIRGPTGAVRKPLVRMIQCDSAREFQGRDSPFVTLCRNLGIVLRWTSPYSHHQNGSVERTWRTLQDGMRASLMEARLPASWWPHALAHVAYIINRVPSRDEPSPYFLLTGKEPNLSRLRIFGCTAYKHVDPSARAQPVGETLLDGAAKARKLAHRAEELVYVGNSEVSTAYKLVRRDSPSAVIWNDMCRFDEEAITQRAQGHGHATSAFDVSKPEGAMLRHRVNEFTVLTHRTMRVRDKNAGVGEVGDELVAILRIQTTEYPEGVWTEVDNLLDNNDQGLETVRNYLEVYHEEHRNIFTPIYDVATYTPPDSPRRRAQTRDPVPVPCVVVAIDMENRDGNEMRIAMKSDRRHDLSITLLDVPRSTLTVPSPIGNVALVARRALITAPTAFNVEKMNYGPVQTVTEPRSPKQAQNAPDSAEWAVAMRHEVDTLTSKQTFEFIKELPPGRKAISCIFKLKLKWRKDGTLEKRKARLVALGNYQQFGVDYQQVFAATSQVSSVHLLLCLAVQKGWHCFSFDIISAFVNAPLDEDIYVSLPPEAGPKRRLARLKKSLYGLKQAANSWANASDKLLMSIKGMRRSQTEASWYVYERDGVVAHVLVYVDDYVVCCNDPKWYTWFVRFFKRTYDLNDLGPLTSILGMGVEWGDDKMALSRRVPIERTLAKFGLADAKPSMYPLDPGNTLKLPDAPGGDKPFLNLLGELRYHARSTRPDINTALSILGRFSARHTDQHFECLKRVGRYLKGTPSLTTILQKGVGGANGSLRLSMYVDASYASCPDTGRSITGYVVALNGNVVCATSKRQDTVACSTTEAEIIAFSEGCKELVYIHRLLSEFQDVELPMMVHEDNLATIDVLSNPVNNGRTKHVAVRHFWVRELVKQGTIKMKYIETNDNVADFLTKPLTGEKFNKFRAAILGHTLV